MRRRKDHISLERVPGLVLLLLPSSANCQGFGATEDALDIETFVDLSSSGFDMFQADVDTRPHYVEKGLNDQPCIEFEEDELRVMQLALEASLDFLPGTDSWTTWEIFRQTLDGPSGGSAYAFCKNGDSPNFQYGRASNASSMMTQTSGGVSDGLGTNAMSQDLHYLFRGFYKPGTNLTGGNVNMRDTDEITMTTGTTQSAVKATLGARRNTADTATNLALTGEVDLLAVSNKEASLADIALVNDYIRRRFNPIVSAPTLESIDWDLLLYGDSGLDEADGVAIDDWTSAASGGDVFSQATGSKQPIFRATGAPNSRGAVEFDGTDDILQAASNSVFNYAPGTDEFSIFILSKRDTNHFGLIFGKTETTVGNRQYEVQVNSTNFITYIGGQYNSGQMYDGGTGTWVFKEVIVSTSGKTGYYDNRKGLSFDNVAIGTGTTTQKAAVGGRGNGANYYDGTIAMIGVLGRVATDNDRRRIYDIVSNHYDRNLFGTNIFLARFADHASVKKVIKDSEVGASVGSRLFSNNSNSQWIAQKFVAGSTYTAKAIKLYLEAVGSPVNNINVAIYDDNTNEPGSQVGTAATAINASTLPTSEEVVLFTGMSASLTSGNTYWIVVNMSFDVSNHAQWHYTNTDIADPNQVKDGDGTGPWTVLGNTKTCKYEIYAEE